MKTITVGLTGQSGAGKTTVCEFFEKADFGIINCDKVAHDVLLTKECKSQIISAFPQVSLSNGEIDRKSLGEIVFSDENSLSILNKITHPLILNKVKLEIDVLKKKFSVVIIDAPTLFESGANSLCDTIVAVIAENDILIKRLCERDNINETLAKQRIKRQHDHEFFIKSCDYIIKNNGGINNLEEQADQVIIALKQKL